jgi:hypothetical protein
MQDDKTQSDRDREAREAEIRLGAAAQQNLMNMLTPPPPPPSHPRPF